MSPLTLKLLETIIESEVEARLTQIRLEEIQEALPKPEDILRPRKAPKSAPEVTTSPDDLKADLVDLQRKYRA